MSQFTTGILTQSHPNYSPSKRVQDWRAGLKLIFLTERKYHVLLLCSRRRACWAESGGSIHQMGLGKMCEFGPRVDKAPVKKIGVEISVQLTELHLSV